MKIKIIISILLISNMLFSQVPPLENHIWKLERIVTVDSTLVVTPSIYFSGLFFDNFYVFGSCSDIGAETIYQDTNMTFNAIFPQLNFQTCPNLQELMDIEDFFIEEFFFIDTNQMTTHDPFSYQFSTTSNKIYLDITNNEGSVATFYDDLLSQEEFLEKSISIYPNPVDKVLHIDPANAGIHHLEVFDLQGRLIIEASEVQGHQIDVSALPQGIYILKIETDKGIHTEKVVKE